VTDSNARDREIEFGSFRPSLGFDNARFLAFIVMGATAFLGEVQLSALAHATTDDLGKWILVTATLLAGVIAAWGAFAGAEAFAQIATVVNARVMAAAPTGGTLVAHRPSPGFAGVAESLQGRMARSVVEAARKGRSWCLLDAPVFLFVGLLALLFVWSVL